MTAFWCRFGRHRAACVEAEDLVAAEMLARDITGEAPTQLAILPYPANPRLNYVNGLSGSPCPSFCFQPNHCAGLSQCPRNPVCND